MMKHLFVSALVLLMLGCAISKEYPEVLPYQPSEKDKGSYVVGIGDQLSISVWRNPDLSVSVSVRPDGKISVPLVGDVQAASLTSAQLAESLTKGLANYVRTPQVTVIVANAVSSEYLHRLRITGAINAPTSVPHREGMTVLDLVLMAGGLTPYANANDAKLYRNTSEGTQVYPVYLDDILNDGDLRSNYSLSPSDILTVPETAF